MSLHRIFQDNSPLFCLAKESPLSPIPNFYEMRIVFGMCIVHELKPCRSVFSWVTCMSIMHNAGIYIKQTIWHPPSKVSLSKFISTHTFHTTHIIVLQLCVFTGITHLWLNYSQVSRSLLKSVVKFEQFAMHFIVHYTLLFHNQRGYYNSPILQALELPPGRAELQLIDHAEPGLLLIVSEIWPNVEK